MICSMNFGAPSRPAAMDCATTTPSDPITTAKSSSAPYSLTSVPRLVVKLSIILTAMATFRQVMVRPETHSGLRRSTLNSNSKNGGRPALGSAAITSVTETLSPILPFTGGIDLRREGSWTSLTRHVFSVFLPDKEEKDTNSPKDEAGKPLASPTRHNIPHTASLSATDCFCHVNDIAQLTLQDVGQIFRFAMDITRPGFNPSREMTTRQLPRVRKVVRAMMWAVEQSRGVGVTTTATTSRTSSAPGSVDALSFLAAMRVFAEWRLVRQVPAGYKSYEVGMNLGFKDIVQNVAKVESAIHDWIDASSPKLRSPTIGELMEFESESGQHPNLPRLKDRTAAMGLLWVRRQLQYQTAIFENLLLEDRERFPTTTHVVKDAYDQVYGSYHGWAVQKVFTYSFQSAPDTAAIFRHMNPHKLKELEGMKPPQFSSTDESLDDTSPSVPKNKKKNVWGWIVDNVVGRFRKPPSQPGRKGGNNEPSSASDWIDQEMTLDAHQNIASFLETARPLLKDVAQAFKKYNMDDPTKV